VAVPTSEEDAVKVGDAAYSAALEDLVGLLREWCTCEYRPLYYSVVSEKLGALGHDVPAHDGPLPYLLEDCTKAGSPQGKEPMLSALVVLKETMRPSAGFFKLARRFPYNRRGTDEEIWLAEIAQLSPRPS
jgi:hypothetical protein